MSYRDADEAASHRVEELEKRLHALEAEADVLKGRIADATPPSWRWRLVAVTIVTLALVSSLAALR